MLKRATVLCVSVASLLVGMPAESADFYCAAGDVSCLIDAIKESNQNGVNNTIHLEAGTYTLTGPPPPVFDFVSNLLPVIVGSMTIQGPNAPESTVIQRTGPALSRIFTVGATGLLQLVNLTLRGGNVGDTSAGGAISSSGAVGLYNTVIRSSFAGHGGAIEIFDGALVVSDSRIVSTSSDLAGDIVSVGNLCSSCIGTSAFPRSVTILRSSIAGNRPRSGSVLGISNRWRGQILDSDISGNQMQFSGFAVSAGDNVSIIGTTIANNVVTAALRASPGVVVNNSTIAHNSGGLSGSGLRIQNSIVTNNDAFGDCTTGIANLMSLGHNLFGNAAGCGNLHSSDLTGDAGVGALVDAGLPGGAYLPLLSGSPAIDAGEASTCAAQDQRQLVRSIDGNGDGVRACDMGAVEFYPTLNDRVQLTGLRYSFVKPSSSEPFDPRHAAGEFRIRATFMNPGPDICNVVFDVVTLNGPAGTNPIMWAGIPLGIEGTALSATEAYAPLHVRSGESQEYLFSVAVQQRTPINFLINVVGDATSGPCTQ
jgi:hypothetical protein